MLIAKSKRYSCEQMDFIVPFLMKKSVSPQQSTELQRKRFSVPQQLTQKKFSCGLELEEMQKIYCIPKKYSKQHSFKKSRSKLYVTPTVSIKKIQLPKNDYQSVVRINRIFKVHSHANYVPTEVIFPGRDYESTSKELNGDSPILGITFKKKSTQHIESSKVLSQQITVHQSPFSRRQQKKYIRYFKEKKQWDKKRSKNVDLIINNRCKTFGELMSQYRRRMGLKQGKRIFVFDSKDMWMKRVLLDRGWEENGNKESKAFDLFWGNKPYKYRVYAEQRLNHYLNSDLVTSKIGLHRLLAMYKLSKLQPRTFDLSSQLQQFSQQFNKIEFVSKIKKLLLLFQFQDEANNHSGSVLKQLILQLIFNPASSQKQSQVELLMIQILKYCQHLIDNRYLPECNFNLFDDLQHAISIISIFTVSQQSIFRILRDFQLYYSQHSQIQNYTTIGYQNVWIIKNKTSSKGVGISLHNNYSSITKQQNKLAQKYIERPLIFKQQPFIGRKFDIRIWVLVVGSKHPKIYYHQQFYGRICFQQYCLTEATLKNQPMHLSNYSLNKNKFIDGNRCAQSVLFPDQLFKAVQDSLGIHYREKFYYDLEKLLKKLQMIFAKEIVVGSTESNFELFGFDLLIDSVLHLHLLEVNLSARCEERHPTLIDMLDQMANGLINILKFTNDSSLHGWRQLH